MKPKCKACEFYEALHAGLKSHRSQRCGVKLIDTHCKTVAVIVSYDSVLHVCELCGHEVCREFLVNTIVVHMKLVRPEQLPVSVAASRGF